VKNGIYKNLSDSQRQTEKKLAVLLDPDKVTGDQLRYYSGLAAHELPDYFLLGGSLVMTDRATSIIKTLKAHTSVPVILFPGHVMQLNPNADGILFLSLISGRNPELLIGQHVVAAAPLMKSTLEVMSTGYMLIDGGRPTSVSYISGTQPIPHDKYDIMASTAMASALLGHHQIYMDAGSGADIPISDQAIQAVRKAVDLPIWVGGGLRSGEMVYQKAVAGADVIVVGNVLERTPTVLQEMIAAIRSARVSA